MRYRHPSLSCDRILKDHLQAGHQLKAELLRQLAEQLPLSRGAAAHARAGFRLSEGDADAFELEFQENYRSAVAYALAHELQTDLARRGHLLDCQARFGPHEVVLTAHCADPAEASRLPWHHPDAVL